MKSRFISWLPLILVMLLLSGCGHAGYAGPENAVRNELDQIASLDKDSVNAFFSSALGEQADPELYEITRLFFENFQYTIASSRLGKDKTSATVSVSITNMDSHQLAIDLAQKLLLAANTYTQESSEETDCLTLLKDCLTKNEYPLKKSTVVFHLTLKDGSWYVDATPELADALIGGFNTYLDDVNLLKPEVVLDMVLSQFRTFDAQDWISYLEIQDLFSVGNASSDEVDLLFAEQLTKAYDYTVVSTSTEKGKAYCKVRLQGVDLTSILEAYQQKLLAYAATSESVRASDSEISRKTIDLLKESISENFSVSASTITMELPHDHVSWFVQISDDFALALLGNPDFSCLDEATDVSVDTKTTETAENDN